MIRYTLYLAVLAAIISTGSAKCGVSMPIQPQPGSSSSVSILVDDPNFGPVDRSFVIHLPTGYSTNNNVETPLVLDFHGWTGTGIGQMYEGGLDDVADEDTEGGFIVIHGNGHGDPSSGPGWGSWNCSRTDGPLGAPCVIPRPEGHSIHCYDTCTECDPLNSCDFSACYDDVLFVRKIVEYVNENYCLDNNSVHMTGVSNGGMFPYYAASRLNDIVASIAPNAASPFIGFGDVPLDPPVSLIDFHGLLDGTIPYDLNTFNANGEGPHESVISWDYYYYEQKPNTIDHWVQELACSNNNDYPTDMDGVNGWSCQIWSNCRGDTEVVHCTALYAHNYPFAQADPPYIGGTRIMWDFMKRHSRNSKN